VDQRGGFLQRRRLGLERLRAGVLNVSRSNVDPRLGLVLAQIDLFINLIDSYGGRATLGDIQRVDQLSSDLFNVWRSLNLETRSQVLDSVSLCPHGQIEGLCDRCR
jgi:hypothetical protein